MKIVFDEAVWEQYLHWQVTDQAVLKRIDLLIEDITRDSYVGIGKPEQLSANLASYWSRRITEEHRLVYRVSDGELRIAACRYHYQK